MADRNYQDFVKALSEKRENRTFLNSDEDHALDVLVKLFEISQKKVRIFAGSLCKHVGNKPEYVVALSEFIERGGELCILLNNYDEKCAKSSNLYKRLAYYKSKGCNVNVKSTSAKPYRKADPEKKEVHFTIGDDMAYRIETDTEKRTAECNFNNPELAKKTAVFFDTLFENEESKEIDLKKLFDDGDK